MPYEGIQIKLENVRLCEYYPNGTPGYIACETCNEEITSLTPTFFYGMPSLIDYWLCEPCGTDVLARAYGGTVLTGEW